MLAALGAGGALLAVPRSAAADADIGPVGPNGESGLSLDGILLYHRPGTGFVFSPGGLTLKADASPAVAPEIHFKGQNGEWLVGSDVANHGGGGHDFVVAGRVLSSPRRVEDVIYLTPGPAGTRVGIGRTPPTQPFRLETGGQAGDGGIGIVHPNGGTGDPLAIMDSGGNRRMRVDSDYRTHGLKVSDSFEVRSAEVTFQIEVKGKSLVISRGDREVLRIPDDLDADARRLRRQGRRASERFRRLRRRLRRLAGL
jgi:hypothetical protein